MRVATAPRDPKGFPLLIQAMGGLGDGIYARPFIRAHHAAQPELYVSTPWPQLYRDLPGIQFVSPWAMRLRTQTKNLKRRNVGVRWAQVPRYCRKVSVRYMLPRRQLTIVQEMQDRIGLPGPFVFDLPDFGPSPVETTRPVAVVRPVSLRTEWPNAARNPDPAYVARAAELLQAAGFYVVAVADLDPREEPAVPPLPAADLERIRGEFPVEHLLALLQHAAVVVGGVGWIVPAALALRTPAVFIGGGQGMHNAPEKVTDPRIDSSRVRFLLPDDYCRCADMRHACPKTIPDFDARFVRALAEVTVPGARAAA